MVGERQNIDVEFNTKDRSANYDYIEGAKYYVLEDTINEGTVIQEYDEKYLTYDTATREFIEDDLFMQYITPFGVYNGLFREIPPFEVENYIQEYLDKWGMQESIASGFIASVMGGKLKHRSDLIQKEADKLEYKPVAILLPALLSDKNTKDSSLNSSWATKYGFNHKVAKMVNSVTEGHISRNFDDCLEGDINLFNLLVVYAKKSNSKKLYDCLMNSDIYRAYTSTDTSDLDYLFTEQLRMKELLDE